MAPSSAPRTAGPGAQVAPPLPQAAQYLIFSLAREDFALRITSVREIIEFGQLTEMPMMPATVRGVINLRGAVVPVVDLAVRFGKPATEVKRRTCIVIVELMADDGYSEVGIVVDAVSAVIDIEHANIEPPPRLAAQRDDGLVAGMAKVNGRFVIVLDADQVLSTEDADALGAQNDALIDAAKPASG